MNEILAPIYYCFYNDPTPYSGSNPEVDSFYVFTMLMGDVKDGFIRSLDKSD